MSKNEVQPTGGTPIWPLAPQAAGDLMVAGGYGQQKNYSTPGAIDLNLATLWRIASEWRWLILGSMAVALAGAIIITLLTAPQYRASSTLEINPPTVQILDNSKNTQPVMQTDREYLATQYGLLASKSLAERVAQELNLASNEALVPSDADRATRQKIATGILMENFTVEPVPNSRLIRISYIAGDPGLAAQVTNSFADNFINSNLERRYEASSYARNFLQRQIAKVKAELETSERQLVAYAQRQGIIQTRGASLPGMDTVASDVDSIEGQSLVTINRLLADAHQRRVMTEERYRRARGMSAAEVSNNTAGYRSQLAGLEAEYRSKLESFKPDYPDMVRLQSRIEAIRQTIGQEVGTVAGGRSNTLFAEYQAAAAEERSLQGRVNQLKSTVLGNRGRNIQYNILQREVDTNRTMYDALLQRYKEIGVAGGVGTNSVMVVDRAEAPGAPFKPNLIFNMLVGLFAGLLAGMGAALAMEIINDTIKTPDDVRNKLGLPSLGTIPKKKGQEALSEELKDLTSPLSEAYYSLRTSLQFTTDSGAPKVLLITSTRAAEGKSSTTLALSQNFARLGQKVLLIDADLRKPAFVTGAEPVDGLSKLLTNNEPIRPHVIQTQVENLWLLPCGPLPPNPAELLSSPRLRAILSAASSEFDMVIVDGPPVLGLADAPLLGALCKGTLLVVESGKTRTKAAMDALNRLKASGSNVVGAVLTKFKASTAGYGYSYNYEPYRYGDEGKIGKREREIRLIEHADA